jgi:predicted MFS family arabinose efflux permease
LVVFKQDVENVESTLEDSHRATALANTLTNGQLAVVTLGRLALNVAYRIVYPLQPFLAGHLQVDLRTVSALVTVQVLASIASPLGGMLADTRGERTTMTAALAVFCMGAALCALSTSFGGFLAGYALIGLAVALYQPAAQSYLSARTSYARRGWALGVFETSWAMSALLGVGPLMLLVQATGDAHWPFGAILMAGLCSLALVRFGLPPANLVGGSPTAKTPRTPKRHTILTWRPWRLGGSTRRIDRRALLAPSVLGLLGLLLLSAGAVDLIQVVYAAWLKSSFGADEAQLGQVFGLIGVAEFGGSLGSTVLVDRIGKKRAVLLGYGLTGASMIALPLSGSSWSLFLALFFVFYLCFEFSIVSAFPLASGVAPAMRGTVMALSVMMNGIGRALGSQIATPLWQAYGFWANGLVAGSAVFLGVTLCWWFVREREARGLPG